MIWLLGFVAMVSALCMAAPAARAGPARADAGIMISTISDVDFVSGSFAAQFYMWWISSDPAFKPFDVMQILNARQWSVHSVSQRTLADGRTHTSGIVSATINHSWKLSDFPFDSQRLRVIVETPFPSMELEIVTRSSDALLSDLFHVEGFDASNLVLRTMTQRYKSDFAQQWFAGVRPAKSIAIHSKAA